MNKHEYIQKLSKLLSNYEIENKYEILADYEQIITEILLDNDDDFSKVIEKLGEPSDLSEEIAAELGFIKNDKADSDKKEDYDPRMFEEPKINSKPKRYKSNTILYIIKAIMCTVQFILITMFALSLVIFFKYDESSILVNYNDSIDNHITQICTSDDSCLTINTDRFNNKVYTTEKVDIYISEDTSEFLGFIEYTNTYVEIYLHSVSLFIAFGILLTMIVIHILIIRTLNLVIKRNNEYNRRRNYD